MAFESSAIPRALDGLLVLLTAQTVSGGLLDGVTVVDGPPLGAPSDQLLLFIGDSPNGSSPGVQGTQEFVTMPGREREESFSIFCTAYSRSGNTELKVERDNAFSIMAAVEKVIRPNVSGSDITLGGTVRWSAVSGRIAYSPAQTTNGAIVRLSFEVQCVERLSGA